MIRTVKHNGLRIECTYSPDDGGHYAEVYGRTGRTQFVTGIHNNNGAAEAEAKKWIDDSRPAIVMTVIR